MRVLLVEDDPYFCQETEHYLVPAKNIDFLGAVHTVQEFKSKLSEVVPNLILLDLNLVYPRDGIEILEWLQQHHSDIFVIIVTTNRQEIAECYQLGAKGYILKSNLKDLEDTIQKVSKGQVIIPPEIGKELITQMRDKTARQTLELELKDYSKREIEILQLAGKSMNREQIAENLCISGYTVKRHVENILKKSQFKSISEVFQKFEEIL